MFKKKSFPLKGIFYLIAVQTRWLLVAVVLLLPIAGKCQSINWIGSSTDWNLPSNWQGGVVPSTSSDVIITACTTCPILPYPLTINSLTMNTGAKLSLGSH